MDQQVQGSQGEQKTIAKTFGENVFRSGHVCDDFSGRRLLHQFPPCEITQQRCRLLRRHGAGSDTRWMHQCRSCCGMGCPACECPGAWPKSAPAAWGCMPEFTCSRMSLWRSNSWRPRKPESRESFAAAPVVFSDWNLLLLSQFKMIPGRLGT